MGTVNYILLIFSIHNDTGTLNASGLYADCVGVRFEPRPVDGIL
jgi:hypothetical protein